MGFLRGALVVVGLAAAMPGCTRNQYVDVEGWDGEVSISGTPRGFSKKDPRLVRISKEINAAVGHKVRLDFSDQHFPQYSGYWEWLVDGELSKLPRDLRGYKNSNEDAFRKTTKGLRRLEFDFDGARSDPRVEVAEGGRAVKFLLNGEGIDDGALSSALYAGYWEDNAKQLDRLDPRKVPAKRHEAYLDFLEGPAQELAAERAPKEEPERGRAETLGRLIAFEPTIRDAELKVRARERILWQARFFAETIQHEKSAAFVRKAGPKSQYRRAERAFVSWFQKHERSLSPEHREEAIGRLYDGHDKAMLWPQIFPTFDPVAHGLRMLDAWAASGFRKVDRKEPDPIGAAICPAAEPDSRVLHRKYARARGHCKRWYAHVVSDPKLRARLLKHLLATKHVQLVEHTTRHIVPAAAPPDTMKFVAGLSKDKRKWRIAARTLGEAMDSNDDPWDISPLMWVEAAKIWKTRRADRGIALFWLAMNSGKSNSQVKFEEFTQKFGSPVSQADFKAFLAQGPYAFENAGNVWPALAPGFARFPLIEPMLEANYRYNLGQDRARGPDFYEVKSIAHGMAERGETKELAALTRWFERRAKRSAKDEYATRDLLKTLGYRKESAERAKAKGKSR